MFRLRLEILNYHDKIAAHEQSWRFEYMDRSWINEKTVLYCSLAGLEQDLRKRIKKWNDDLALLRDETLKLEKASKVEEIRLAEELLQQKKAEAEAKWRWRQQKKREEAGGSHSQQNETKEPKPKEGEAEDGKPKRKQKPRRCLHQDQWDMRKGNFVCGKCKRDLNKHAHQCGGCPMIACGACKYFFENWGPKGSGR